MAMKEHEKSVFDTNELEVTLGSGTDVFRYLCGQMLPISEDNELTEDDLEFVMGGMSDMQALEVISTAYWDLCVNKKANTKYSKAQIYDALNRCHALNRRTKNGLSDIGKVTSLLLRELNK